MLWMQPAHQHLVDMLMIKTVDSLIAKAFPLLDKRTHSEKQMENEVLIFKKTLWKRAHIRPHYGVKNPCQCPTQSPEKPGWKIWQTKKWISEPLQQRWKVDGCVCALDEDLVPRSLSFPAKLPSARTSTHRQQKQIILQILVLESSQKEWDLSPAQGHASLPRKEREEFKSRVPQPKTILVKKKKVSRPWDIWLIFWN